MSDPAPVDPTLENCPACAEPLDVTDFEPFTNVICPKCEKSTRVKRQLGKYYLERRHAMGGMSVVFVAKDTTLDREVAIKVLNEKYCEDETRVTAFENEARHTAAVNHPNVVRIFTVGRHYNRFYLVMELIEGQNFEIMMTERGALPEDQVLDIALQVAAGLEAASNAGVLHRDVKPGNILFNKEGRTKLVDFGLALITQGGSATAEEIWATPYYVPPEALDKGEEDLRSDIYAFGATLYHALYGKPPFESTSSATKVLRRAKQTIPRLGKVAPWLSNETCEAVDRMMAYQPKHRWSNYGEVIEALKESRKVAGDSHAQAIHGRNRAKRRVKKNPLIMASIAIGVITLLGSLIWITISNRDTVDQPKIVEARPIEIETTGQNTAPDQWITKAWTSAHNSVDAGNYSEARAQLISLADHPDVPLATRFFTETEALLNRYLAGQPGVARSEAQILADKLSQVEDPNRPLRKLRKLCKLLSSEEPPSQQAFSSSPEDLADWVGNLALSLKLWEQGLHSEAAPQLKKIQESSINQDHAWFSSYQSKIAAYLDEAQRIAKLTQTPRPSNLDEATLLLNAAEKSSKLVKTNGRMRYTLHSRIIHLTRIQRGFELRPFDLPNLNWEQLVSLIKKRCLAERFSDAKSLLGNRIAQNHPEAIKAWNYLLDHALSQDQEKAEYQIAFAWLTGKTDTAEKLADTYAAENEEFRRKWRNIIIGLSE